MNCKFSLGCIKDLTDKRDFQAKLKLEEIEEAVPKYSSKDYSDILTPIKQQGGLGSCVGFAVTAVNEFLEQTTPLKPSIDLSEMWVYWKSKQIDEWPTEEGTSIRDALKIVNQHGIPLEKYWIYNDKRTKDNKPLTQPSPWASLSASRRKIKGYYRINNLQEMYDWLDNYGPCLAGIECANSIFNTKSDGFVPTPKPTESIVGGHAIAIVEYDKSEHYIGFKNSWGDSWGDLGYGYLDISYYDNGHFMDMWGITP